MDTIRSDRYCGVILAAGHGTRMRPFSEKYPKPLLPICNKPQIVHQIEFMRNIGIRDVFVLIGHRGFEIAGAIGDGSKLGVCIKYVEQTSALGIAHAVGQLEPHITKPFLLFLGDIYLVPDRLERMFELFEEQAGGGILAAREDSPEAIRKNFAIQLDDSGRVTRVIEKPRHVPNRLKGVGVYLFDLTIFDGIRRTPRTALRDEYELTDSIQVMIDQGHIVRPASVILQDINLTNPGDLLRCNLLHANIFAHTAIDAHSDLHPDSQIRNSVIGRNVKVQHPISIVESVIFDDTTISANTQLERVIVTPEMFVDCRYFLEGSALSAPRGFVQAARA